MRFAFICLLALGSGRLAGPRVELLGARAQFDGSRWVSASCESASVWNLVSRPPLRWRARVLSPDAPGLELQFEVGPGLVDLPPGFRRLAVALLRRP
jgi:hypothetical protein